MCPVKSTMTVRDNLRTENIWVVSGGCGTFYTIIISSDAFKGLPTVKQHRLVNETLKQEIEGIHGLQARPVSFPLNVSL